MEIYRICACVRCRAVRSQDRRLAVPLAPVTQPTGVNVDGMIGRVTRNVLLEVFLGISVVKPAQYLTSDLFYVVKTYRNNGLGTE